jgi:hypothetical protein
VDPHRRESVPAPCPFCRATVRLAEGRQDRARGCR